MGNFLYHNKWHRYNHHTVSVSGFPDSAIDPIASQDFPFVGNFTTLLPFLCTGPNRFEPIMGSTWDPVSGVWFPQDSFSWWSYSSLTKTESGDWNLFNSVSGSIAWFNTRWTNGAVSFTFWRSNSAFINTAYLTTSGLSAEYLWPFVVENSLPPISGVGWMIALSSTTWKSNIAQVDTRQKNAFAVNLGETAEIDGGRTLNWNVSTAQTVYLTLTGNYTLTADKVFNPVRGGKYTMWIALDYCPEPFMNVVFNADTYRIFVKKLNEPSYNSLSNIITLSANFITRIDFVFDGTRMLGKATQYRLFLPTTKDAYYSGVGSILIPDPAEIDGTTEPDTYFKSNTPGVVISPFSSQFTSVSARYVAGTGVVIDYFGTGTNLLRFTLRGASWLPTTLLGSNRALTASFDRVFGNLSGGGDYNFSAFSGNLFATPLEISAPQIMKDAYPSPPYRLGSNTTVEVPQCLSGLVINIVSGKDRDIRNISVDKEFVFVKPIIINNEPAPYTFNNERQTQITLNRIQKNYNIVVTFERQVPLQGDTPLLWFDIIDQTALSAVGSNVFKVESKPDNSLFALQNTVLNRPFISVSQTARGLDFSTSYTTSTSSFMTLNRPLTGLANTSNPLSPVLNFTTFTVLVPLTTNPTNAQPEAAWWMGEYIQGLGYGVGVRGRRPYVGMRTNSLTGFTNVFTDYTTQSGVPFLISSVVRGDTTKKSRGHDIYLNGRQVRTGNENMININVDIKNFDIRLGSQNLNFITSVTAVPLTGTLFGAYKLPNGNLSVYTTNNAYINAGNIMPTFGRFRILAIIIYSGALERPRLTAINNYLINKYNISR